jgi:hypothetical protein
LSRISYSVSWPWATEQQKPFALECQSLRLADALMITVAIAKRAQTAMKKNIVRTCP